ncbi:MAG: sodium:proton antiporter [Desulfurococcaceae archaeon]
MINEIRLDNPIQAVFYIVINFAILLVVLGAFYILLKPGSRRKTSIYLSGEGEEVISFKSITPSTLNLYWFFIKRFAKKIYEHLVNTIHTGNLMDWVEFMVSWYGLLIIASILTTIIYMFMYKG